MTFLRMAVTVSRAITLAPMAAWMATSNIWRGMSSRIFETRARPRVIGKVAVDDDGERVDGVAADENVHLDHGRDPGAGQVVVERSVAAGDGLQLVVEVEDYLVQRKLVGKHDAGGR